MDMRVQKHKHLLCITKYIMIISGALTSIFVIMYIVFHACGSWAESYISFLIALPLTIIFLIAFLIHLFLMSVTTQW